MKQPVILVAVFAVARSAAGQNADDYRGGWRTDSGEAHTYEFSIRGATVRGIYCTYCADATTLAFVDGTFGPDGIRFEVTHVKADGRMAYKDKALARFSQGRLVVTGTSGARGGGTFERVLIKDPHGPDPIPVAVSVLPKNRPSVAVPVETGRQTAFLHPAGSLEGEADRENVIGVWLDSVKARRHTSSSRRPATNCAAWCVARATTPTRWRRWTTSASMATS
jgi:hypothetical protein